MPKTKKFRSVNITKRKKDQREIVESLMTIWIMGIMLCDRDFAPFAFVSSAIFFLIFFCHHLVVCLSMIITQISEKTCRLKFSKRIVEGSNPNNKVAKTLAC
jgi:hypothetical protein